MAGKVDQDKEQVFAELMGRGLTIEQACQVLDIGLRTGERWNAKPHVREAVEGWKKRLFGNTDDALLLDELLQSDDPRVVISALVLKEKLGLFEKGESAEDDELPEGAYIVYLKPSRADEYAA